MKNKKELVIVITLVSAAIFFITLYRAFFYAPTDEIPLPEGLTQESLANRDPLAYPMSISIPKLQIDTKIVEVGITSRGNMGTPDNYSNVGWYKYGTLPGDIGSAVMAGHVDNGLSLAGIFANLKNLEIGDDIVITNRGEQKLHFTVTQISMYDFDDRNTNVFTENDGRLLKLITCVGTWISEDKTHDKRLVVTAVLSSKL